MKDLEKLTKSIGPDGRWIFMYITSMILFAFNLIVVWETSMTLGLPVILAMFNAMICSLFSVYAYNEIMFALDWI